MIIKCSKKLHVPILFVHIPKNAGGSVNEYLKSNKSIIKACGHKTIQEIKRKLYNNNPKYNSVSFEDYFKFTIFRNPWERVLSNFKFRTQIDGPDPHWEKVRKLNLNFNEWIKIVVNNTGMKTLKKHNTYLSYITINKKIAVDYIINFHNLNEEFKVIKKLCKFNRNLGDKVHKSKRKNYKFYYNDKSIELVSEIHKDDIKLFKFNFDNTNYMDLSMIENKCKKAKEIIEI